VLLREETWFTSDLHIGHANIVSLCRRPFADVEEMNESIIERINRTVPESGTLVILGDAVMGRIAETLPILSRIASEVLLVPGNHDRCWEGNGGSFSKWTARYETEGGVSRVLPSLVETEIGGVLVCLSHFPASGDSLETPRFQEHRPPAGGWLLHGHTHGAWRQNQKMIDVGIDSWGGSPVSLSDIREIIKYGPALMDKLEWC
jgi:calcineurin-like phosphoesterase family protein